MRIGVNPWPKDFLEAGKKRLAGDTARAATSDEGKDLRREASARKEVVAERTLENRLLKNNMADGVPKCTSVLVGKPSFLRTGRSRAVSVVLKVLDGESARVRRFGIVMSGLRPLIKGLFCGDAMIVGAVMSSAYRCGLDVPRP